MIGIVDGKQRTASLSEEAAGRESVIGIADGKQRTASLSEEAAGRVEDI